MGNFEGIRIMKKRLVRLLCGSAYLIVPVLAIAAQAYLSSEVTAARHAYNEHSRSVMPATWQAGAPAPETPVRL